MADFSNSDGTISREQLRWHGLTTERVRIHTAPRGVTERRHTRTHA